MAANAVFTADFTKWDAALRNATAQLKQFEIPVKGVRAQLERMAVSFSGAQIHKEATLAVTAVKSIGGAAKLTTAELDKFGRTVDESIQKSQRMGQTVSKAFKDIQAEIRGAQLERLTGSLSGSQIQKEAAMAVTAIKSIGGASKLTNQELQQFGRTIDEAVQKAQRMGQTVPKAFKDMQAEIRTAEAGIRNINFASLGEKATRLGLVMSAAVTAPIAGAGYAAIKFSTDFEKTMTKVVTLSGVSQEKMLEFRDAILEMAPAVGRGPNELAKALLVVTSTGIRGGDALEILEQSAKASSVGLGETETVARALTAVINSYGKENITAAHAADVLYRAVKAGGAEATELAPVLGRVTGVAAQLGVSFEELGAFIATFTRLGVNASESVTSLGGVMSTLLKPSEQGAEALKKYELSMEGIRQEVREKGLTEALLHLVEVFKNNEDELSKVIPNIRAFRGVLGTAGAQSESFGEVLGEVKNEFDTLNGAFDRGDKTIARTFEKLKAQGETLAITMGDALAPALSEVLNVMKPFLGILVDMAKAFADLPKPLQDVIILFVAFVGLLGPVIFGIGRLAQAIGAIQGIGGFAGLAKAMQTMGLATGGVVVGVGAATVAIGLLEESTNDSVEAFRRGEGTWSDVGGVMANAVARGLVPFYAAWRDIAQGINEATTAWELFRKEANKDLPSVRRPKLDIPQTSVAIKDFSGASKELNKIYNELSEGAKKAGETTEVAFEKMRQATAAAKEELAKLSGKQIAELRAGLKSGAIDAEFLKNALNGNEIAARMFQNQMQEVNKELKKSDARQAAEAMKELVQDLNDAQEAGMSTAEIMDQYGNQIKKVTFAARQNSQAIPEMIKQWERLANADAFKGVVDSVTKGIAKLGRLGKDGANKWWDGIREASDGIVKATGAAYEAMVKAHNEAEDAIAQRTMTATEFQMRQIEKQRQAQIDALDIKALGDQYQATIDEINRAAEELTTNLQHQGIIQLTQRRNNLREMYEIDKQTLDDILAYNLLVDSQIIQGEKFTNEQIKRLKKKLKADLDAIAAEAGKSWASKFGDALKGGLEGLATDITQTLVDAAIHGSSAKQVATALGTSIGGYFGQSVGSIFGPIGAAIGKTLGAALGGLLGKIFKTDGDRAVSELGREWGVTISSQMGEAIEETMKTKFKGMRNNRWAAEVFNLGEIIQDIGGVTQDNVTALTNQLGQAFNFLHDGIFNVADVQKVLEDSFGQLTDFYTSRNAFISKSLKDIIALDKELGINSKAVSDFVAAQADRAVVGFNKIAQNFLTLVTGFQSGSEDMKTLLEDIDEAIKDSGDRGKFAPEFIADIEKNLTRIGPIVQATFGALIEGGASVVEAILKMGPGLEQIKKILTATGVSATGFLGQITGWQGIIDKNKELFEILSGVDDALKGLHNSNALTQESFASLASIVSDSFATLQRQGVAAGDAYALLAPQLQELWELQRDFGYVVDEATQNLLNQAEAAGVVGDAHRSVEEQMLVATERMADAAEYLASVFGYQIPQAMDATATAAGKMADGVGAAFERGYDDAQKFQGGLPDEINVPINFPVPDRIDIPDSDLRGFSDQLLIELEKIRNAMNPEEASALSRGYSQALAEGFTGSIDAFQAQQLAFYQVLQEGDSRLKTFFSDTSVAAYDAFMKVGEGMTGPMRTAMEQLRSIMVPDEAKALAEGYAQAISEGFTGSLDAFQKQQLDYYATLQEGDERLKTYFYGSTLEMYRAITEAGEGVFDPIVAGISAAIDQFQTLGPEGSNAVWSVIDSLSGLAATGQVTAEGIRNAIIPALQALGPEGEAAITAILDAIGLLPENVSIPVDFPTTDFNISDQLLVELEKIREAMSPTEAAALSMGYSQALAEGFTGSIDAFQAQQLAFYQVLQEGDSRLKTFFSDASLAAYDAFMKVGDGITVPMRAAMEQLRSIMSPDEAAALSEGYAQAISEGFTGSLDAFQKQQLDYYATLQEGDERLKTFFMGSTLEMYRAITSGGEGVFDPLIAGITAAIDQLKTFGPEGDAAIQTVIQSMATLAGTGQVTADSIRNAIIPVLQALGPEGEAAIAAILSAIGELPENVSIPVDFPAPDEIPMPRYPLDISIPVNFPAGSIEVPDHPEDISIPVDFPTPDEIDIPRHPADIQIPVDFPVDSIEVPDHPSEISIPVEFPEDKIVIPEHPVDVTIPVKFPADLRDAIAELDSLGDAGLRAFEQIEEALTQLGPMTDAQINAMVASMASLGPEGQEAVRVILEAIGSLPDTIDIPVDFPMPDVIEMPEHPDGVEIPVDFPVDSIDIPEHPGRISIPVDVDLSAFDGLEEVRASLEALGPAGAKAFRDIEDALLALATDAPGAADQFNDAILVALNALPPEARATFDRIMAEVERLATEGPGVLGDAYTDCWKRIGDVGAETSDFLRIKWIEDQADAAGKITGPFSDAWGTISSEGVSMSEDVANAIRTIPEDMPEVRDKIIEALTSAGVIGSGKDGIGRVADALRDLPGIAGDVASDIESELKDIEVPEIRIPVSYDQKNTPSDIEQERVRAYAMGGPVYAAGGMFIPRGTDTVPAMLTPGEFVVNRRAVNRVGLNTLHNINNGGDTGSGGSVRTTGPVTNYFTIQAWDGEDVVRVLTTDPRVKKAMGVSAMQGIEMGGDAGARFDRRVKRTK